MRASELMAVEAISTCSSICRQTLHRRVTPVSAQRAPVPCLTHRLHSRECACRYAQQELRTLWGAFPPHARLQRLIEGWLHPQPEHRGTFRSALEEARVIRDELHAQLQAP